MNEKYETLQLIEIKPEDNPDADCYQAEVYGEDGLEKIEFSYNNKEGEDNTEAKRERARINIAGIILAGECGMEDYDIIDCESNHLYEVREGLIKNIYEVRPNE